MADEAKAGSDSHLTTRVGSRAGARITSPAEAHKLLWARFVSLDREHLWRIDVDGRRRLLGAELVSIGSMDATLADPRMVFRGAIAAGASGIILLHNHPSGDVSPSQDDRAVAARLEACGLILGIAVIDQVIVHNEKHFSMRAGK